MTQYATSIAIVSGSTLTLLLSFQLWLSYSIWKRRPDSTGLLVLLAIAFATIGIWFVLSLPLLFLFAFCSSCFGPGSPQERVFFWSIGLPMEGMNLSEVGGLFLVALILLGLFAFGTLCSILLTKLPNRSIIRVLAGLSMCALTSAAIVASAAIRVNAHPNGLDPPMPSNAYDIKDEGRSEYWGLLNELTYRTPDSPDDVYNLYLRTLPWDGWVTLYDNSVSPPRPGNEYWRESDRRGGIYLHVAATPTEKGDTLVHIEINMQN